MPPHKDGAPAAVTRDEGSKENQLPLSYPNDPQPASAKSTANKRQTPREAINAYYLWLYHGSRREIRACPMWGNPLYPHRLGKRQGDSDRPAEGQREPDPRTGADYRFDPPLRPAKAIRQHCLDCAGGPKAVKACSFGPDSNQPCPLWTRRLGKELPDVPRSEKKRCDATRFPEEVP